MESLEFRVWNLGSKCAISTHSDAISANLFFQLVEHKRDSRTETGIFESEVFLFDEYIFVGVRKTLTVSGPHLIDGTIVVSPQKGTRALFYDKVVVGIQLKIGFDEYTFLEFEMFCYALDVCGIEGGRIVFATSRTV